MIFSIIIPVYNVAKHVRKCLFSVCNQTYDALECIIVNDATPDSSMNIVDDILKEYKGNIQFKILTHEFNKGLSAARNTGVKAATGDYVFFLDSDDELPGDAMMSFWSYLQKYGVVDFLIGNYNIIGNFYYNKLTSSTYVNSRNSILSDYMAGKWYVMACGKLINRSFFLEKDMWFKEGLLHEDELFSFRLAMLSSTMITVPEKVYCYYIHNDSIMKNKIYRNFSDHFSIISVNLELADKEMKILTNKLVIRYFISVFYGFVFSVINSCRLTVLEKKKFVLDIQNQMKKLNISNRNIGSKMFLEYGILKMNYNLIGIIMKGYYYCLVIKSRKYAH